MVGYNGSQEEAFDVPACLSFSVKTSGQHGGVVAKKRVTASEKLRKIGETVMGHVSLSAIHDQQP